MCIDPQKVFDRSMDIQKSITSIMLKQYRKTSFPKAVKDLTVNSNKRET